VQSLNAVAASNLPKIAFNFILKIMGVDWGFTKRARWVGMV